MNSKNTVRTVVAAIMAVSLGLSGPALAGDRHHGGHGHSYSGGHGYSHNRGHGGYRGGGHGYNHHRGHRGYGHGRNYYDGYGGRYYRDSHGDLLLGLILGGVTGYALRDGHRH